MKKRIIGLAGIIISIAIMLSAIALLYSTYQSTQAPLQKTDIRVQGVVLEKLTERRPDWLLPFKVNTYVVRYAFPSAQGQMRTSEQVVTQKFYESLIQQGDPIWVMLSAQEPSINAIDARMVFPGASGWHIGLAMFGLMVSTVISTLSFIYSKRDAPGAV